jgi:hypothetical protein
VNAIVLQGESEEGNNMQKNRSIVLVGLVFALFLSYAATTVMAANSITVSQGVISVGGTEVITVTTDAKASGPLKVKDPNGNTWTASADISIPAGGGSDSRTYPTDFPGADTNTVGSYETEADLTIGKVSGVIFRVEFFAYPDLPFGTLMAVVACFGAFLGYKKLKQ